MEIQGKSFVITGGASGLGAATAQHLIQRGGSVVIADVDGAGEAFAKSLGAQAAFISTDVTREDDAQRAIVVATNTFGAVHGLVNCAGVAPSERLVGRNGPHALESFSRAVAINLVGTFNMMRLAAAAMSRNAPTPAGERGVIINTASIAAFEGQIGQAAYAASKAGVVGLTLPAARELARTGIRVVTIAPGIFMTPMMAGFSAEIQSSLAQSVPFPSRLGQPEEFAALVETICRVTMLNGETIRLDGALRMPPR